LTRQLPLKLTILRHLRLVTAASALAAVAVIAATPAPSAAQSSSSGVPAAPQRPAGQQPNIAVYGFSSEGLNPWWGGSFDPGGALSDILTDRLVNSGTFSVVDRAHIAQVLGEQGLAQSGDVTPATEAKLGRMLGANYLIVGRIVQFDRTGNQGGGVSSLLGGLGGVSSSKTLLRVSMHVLEINSGRIVQAVDDEQSSTATSFAVAGFGAASGIAYQSQDFQSSAMGKLLTAVANDLVSKIDPTKMVATGQPQRLSGHIIGVDGDSYVLNIGTNKGASVGMMFDIVDTRELRDPDSGKMLTTEIPRGTIQIVTTSADTSIAKRVSGHAHVGQAVHSSSP
jgi:curli biogenesis system outer membrane secretion channel CsgG